MLGLELVGCVFPFQILSCNSSELSLTMTLLSFKSQFTVEIVYINDIINEDALKQPILYKEQYKLITVHPDNNSGCLQLSFCSRGTI